MINSLEMFFESINNKAYTLNIKADDIMLKSIIDFDQYIKSFDKKSIEEF